MLGTKGAVMFERGEVAHVVVRDIEWGGGEFSSKVEHLVKRIGEWWGECLLVLSEKDTFRLREQVVSHDQYLKTRNRKKVRPVCGYLFHLFSIY